MYSTADTREPLCCYICIDPRGRKLGVYARDMDHAVIRATAALDGCESDFIVRYVKTIIGWRRREPMVRANAVHPRREAVVA